MNSKLNSSINMKTLLSLLALVLMLTGLKAQNNNSVSAYEKIKVPILKTNENYIRNINNEISLDNTINVFKLVFNLMKPEVTVYPTENYYYYQFESSGKTIKGNIALFADERDDGKLNFAFEEINNLPDASINVSEGVEELDSTKGVNVQKINDFEYDVTFKNKTVKFFLNRLDINPPRHLNLLQNEVYVGPSVDESGLKFHLIYNNAFKNLFWVLDEEYYTPESFTELFENTYIGNRTEFIFYEDKELARKILFGVKNENVRLNNWFDGPFDQLPDNYIKSDQINLKMFIEEVYPFYKGKIDKYGHFLDEASMRVAISSYLVYKSYTEVAKVYYACKNSTKTKEEFIYHLTEERSFEKKDEHK
jgi:hypothetical protein